MEERERQRQRQRETETETERDRERELINSICCTTIIMFVSPFSLVAANDLKSLQG